MRFIKLFVILISIAIVALVGSTQTTQAKKLNFNRTEIKKIVQQAYSYNYIYPYHRVKQQDYFQPKSRQNYKIVVPTYQQLRNGVK